MRWTRAAVTIGIVGALTVPVAGTATAAPAAQSAAHAVAVKCQLMDFVGYYCGYTSQNTYADRGDTGAKVKEIQALLILHGYSVGPSGVDGRFGAGTEGAVKRFQSAKKIGVDGKVGPNTWYYLRTPGA
ncbi:peptidoglycan-binding domain-containing protein [Streptomyces sp. NPDC007369]|uniref:peptidoglycan-binding domain-containing protein n=1 Tax=Streptomyces sp. NPDC007369 TaxID=3154589 RepID=UPI0033C2DEDC